MYKIIINNIDAKADGQRIEYHNNAKLNNLTVKNVGRRFVERLLN